jgi:hypothetical protein
MSISGRRISILLSFAFAAAISMPLPVSAVSPQDNGSDPNAIAQETTHFEVGDLADATAAARSVPGARGTAATTACKYAYWIAEARDAVGIVLFQYKEQVDWCENGTYIIGTPQRTTKPVTPAPLSWGFVSETLFDPSANSSNPDTISSMTYTARGTFAWHVYPLPWPVSYSYPTVSITIRGNGTASGTISW